jgi:hypothetical protein
MGSDSFVWRKFPAEIEPQVVGCMRLAQVGQGHARASGAAGPYSNVWAWTFAASVFIQPRIVVSRRWSIA